MARVDLIPRQRIEQRHRRRRRRLWLAIVATYAACVLAGALGNRQRSQAARSIHGEIDDFRGHDLRRTAASCMTSDGVSRLVVAKVLNHAERGVTAVYDRHSYDPEKRVALDTWAGTLAAILARKDVAKVVPFARQGE